MATIAENIQTLKSIKSDIKNAIIQKGGSVTDAFGTYAQAITNLPSGGGNEDLVNLIERDVTSFTIPDGTTKIGYYAFSYCTSLTNVTIGNGVTQIGNYAFYYCKALTDVTIPNSVTSIGNAAFSDCSGLTNVTIGNSVTSIGNSAFSYCSSLTSVTIGNGVTSIGNSAFYYCSDLMDVTIGNGVTSIVNHAFSGCSSLTSLTILATTPPTLNSSAFNNTNNCPIYVPAESVDAYKTATNWSAYADRIQAIPTV